MRFGFAQRGLPPSPPPRIVLSYRGEPFIEFKHSPIHWEQRRPDHPECHPPPSTVSPPPPPSGKPPTEPPEGSEPDPQWPPGDLLRRLPTREGESAAKKPPSNDKPFGETAPAPGNPLPEKLTEPGKGGKSGLPNDLPELSWPQLMSDLPQLRGLPPLIREFFRYTPEPELLHTLNMMIAQGLNPAAKDEMGNSLLMLAAATGKPMLVKFLIERFPLLINSLLNRFGENAATLAQAYCPEALALMLKAGIELHPQNPALQWYLSQSEQVPFTMSRMQELSVMLSQDNYVNLRDETGKTLLFHAVIRGDVDVVRFLCNLSVGPAVVWRDQAGKSLFGYTTGIADVRLGSMICKELKALRRRDRPLYKRTLDRY